MECFLQLFSPQMFGLVGMSKYCPTNLGTTREGTLTLGGDTRGS